MDTIKHVNIRKDFIAVDYNDSDTMGAFYTHIDIPTFDAIMNMIEENNKHGGYYSVSFIDNSEDSLGRQRHTINKVRIVGMDITRSIMIPVEFDPLSDNDPVELPKSSFGSCKSFVAERYDGLRTSYEVLE